MKSVIMIAHSFPPEGNAGVYRPLRFVRHLAEFGWHASVVSAEKYSYERYDSALLEQIPSDTEVVRVRGRDLWQSFQAGRGRKIEATRSAPNTKPPAQSARPPAQSAQPPAQDLQPPAQNGRARVPIRSRIRSAVRKFEAMVYRPDMAMLWIDPAVKATVELCDRTKPDVLWATAAPVSSFVVAQRVSRQTGIPYVLDFRDPKTITQTPFDARRPASSTRAIRRSMYGLLKDAQAVTFRFDVEAECFCRAYGGALDDARIHIIPNGYEGCIDSSTPPHGDRCTILYAGTLTSYRFDTLMEGIACLKRTDPERARHLRIRFMGEGQDELTAAIRDLSLQDIIETEPATTQDEVVASQRDAHGLLVLGRPPSKSGHELYAGAKLYAYLKAGRPIVGVVPNDETRKTLQQVGVTTIADVESVPEIVDVVTRTVDAWQNGTLSELVPDRSACHQFSAEIQTAALVRALEGSEAADPFVAGTVDVPPSLRDEIGDRPWLTDSKA